MDVLTPEQRSYCMSRIRHKNTKPELALRKALWSLGLRYRIHYKLPGKPDIVFINSKITIFVDGCFWHGCPSHSVRSKTNTKFWDEKISTNINRDKRNQIELEARGWKVIRIWEHEIHDSIVDVLERIIMTFKSTC